MRGKRRRIKNSTGQVQQVAAAGRAPAPGALTSGRRRREKTSSSCGELRREPWERFYGYTSLTERKQQQQQVRATHARSLRHWRAQQSRAGQLCAGRAGGSRGKIEFLQLGLGVGERASARCLALAAPNRRLSSRAHDKSPREWPPMQSNLSIRFYHDDNDLLQGKSRQLPGATAAVTLEHNERPLERRRVGRFFLPLISLAIFLV